MRIAIHGSLLSAVPFHVCKQSNKLASAPYLPPIELMYNTNAGSQIQYCTTDYKPTLLPNR
jgi:hypothetical protein